MKLSCNVILDLLPLYADGCCSTDTTALVEEHLEQCDLCRQALKEMNAELPSSLLEPEPAKEEAALKKGLKKIRHRWIASLIAVLMIFPIAGLGLMGYHQFRGEGVCFTNVDDIYTANRFWSALKAGDYEKAFSYLDIDVIYQRNYAYSSVLPDLQAYQKGTIDGIDYYFDDCLTPAYEDYLQSQDSRQFWYCALEYETIAPADVISELQTTTDEELLYRIKSSAIGNYLDDYQDAFTQNGQTYVALSPNVDDPIQTLLNNYYLIPAACYSELITRCQEDEAAWTRQTQALRDLTLEQYRAQGLEIFISDMQALVEQGFIIEKTHLRNTYKSVGDTWQADFDVTTTGSTRGIILHIDGDRLQVSGGYHDPMMQSDSDPLLDALTNWSYELWDMYCN